MIFLTGLAEIAEQFDLFLLDQFGVLHDGVRAYAGATAVLHGLQAAGKAVAVISNSGRSGEYNRTRMAARLFPGVVLPPIVTSGDCLRPWLEAEFPGRCLNLFATGVLDNPSPQWVLVSDIGEADLLLLNSFSDQAPDRDLLEQLLKRSLERQLPMVCTNPDETALKGDVSFPAPGAFARDYQRRGGKVTFIGKPFPLIFEMALARFRSIPKTRAIYIGDSLDHDVRGADAAGIKSAWVLNGVHRAEFAGQSPAARPLHAQEIARQAGLAPSFAIDELSW